MTVTTFTFPYVNTPAFFSGTSSTTLVPNVFPVGIDGRPYQIDQKSGRFTRGYEPRVRDSQDISTAPGEAAINPGGLWRRGQDSWHLGAGQKYADAAAAIDYRYYKSKGVNPWVKGQLTLLNSVKVALSTSTTNLRMVSTSTRVYVLDGANVKYTTDPFNFISSTITNVSASAGTITYTTSSNHGFTAGAIVDITGVDPPAFNLTGATLATASTNTFTITNAATGTYVSGGTAVQRPIWTTASGLPSATPIDITSDGSSVYITYPGTTNTYGLWKYTNGGTATNIAYGHEYGNVDFVKGFFITTGNAVQGNGNDLYFSPTGNVAADDYEHPVPTFEWIGSATGQSAIYIAGKSGDFGGVYKLTIKSDGTLDTPVEALELPEGEYPTDIFGYLGFILVGTNKGVRFCTTDSQNNLSAGSLIPTGADVRGFTAEDRFVWFGWTNYDGSSGIGRLDLSSFTAPNTPAYATDLMYNSSTNAVQSIVTFNGKRVFSISGVGVVAEDSATLASSGTIEVGTYRWGIPDRKFVAKVDTRAEPLDGSIISYLALDNGTYTSLGTWNTPDDTENTLDGSSQKTIQASFKFELKPSDTNVSPVMTRWMTRAYAAPFRSQVFSVPLLLHKKVRAGNKDYYFDTSDERLLFDDLIASPRIITLQVGHETHTVIVEDVEEIPLDSSGNTWDFEGTLVVTMRSVEN